MACTFIVQVKRKVRTSVILLPQHIYYICTLHEGETLMHEGEILSIHNYFLVAMACLINGIYAPQQFKHQYLDNKKQDRHLYIICNYRIICSFHYSCIICIIAKKIPFNPIPFLISP